MKIQVLTDKNSWIIKKYKLDIVHEDNDLIVINVT